MKLHTITEGGFKDRAIIQQEAGRDKMLWDYKITNKSADARGMNISELNGQVQAKSEADANRLALRQYCIKYRGLLWQATSKRPPPVEMLITHLGQSDTLTVVVYPSKI